MLKEKNIILNGSVGISGCKLLLTGDKVKKISSSSSFNNRLVLQAEKQLFFKKNIHIPYISTPDIHTINKNNKKAFFTMDLINGSSWQEFFTFSNEKDITKFTSIIINYLKILRKESTKYEVTELNNLITNKLDSLLEKSHHKELIINLIKYIQKNQESIPKSFFHGDLTLSNILFKDDNLYFIDFLDSCVETYLLDIIKLRQDLLFYWCLDYNGIRDSRFIVIFDIINKSIEEEFKTEYNDVFHILELLNILRIEPYIPKSKRFIVDRMLLKKQISI